MIWLTKNEAALRYNKTIHQIENLYKIIPKEDRPQALKRKKETTGFLLNKDYLDKHFDWFRISKSKTKKEFSVNISDFHWWLSNHKWDSEKRKRITTKKYRLFITTFFDLLTDKIVKESFIFHLPYKLGSFYIKKINKDTEIVMPTNYNHFKKTGKVVRHSNKHTFGFRFTLKFDRNLAHFNNQGITYIRSSNIVRRKLYKEIMDRIGSDKKTYNAH